MEQNIQELWDNYKEYSIHIMRMPEGKGEKETEKKKKMK